MKTAKEVNQGIRAKAEARQAKFDRYVAKCEKKGEKLANRLSEEMYKKRKSKVEFKNCHPIFKQTMLHTPFTVEAAIKILEQNGFKVQVTDNGSIDFIVTVPESVDF